MPSSSDHQIARRRSPQRRAVMTTSQIQAYLLARETLRRLKRPPMQDDASDARLRAPPSSGG